MKLLVFTVYDKAVQAYLQPFYVRSQGEALRSFTEACNDGKSNFAKYASDYYLVRLGEFDDASGVFYCFDPQRVVSAVECVESRDVFEPKANGSAAVQRLDVAGFGEA